MGEKGAHQPTSPEMTVKITEAQSAQQGPPSTRRILPRELYGFLFVGPAILFFVLVSIFPLLRTFQMSLIDVEAGIPLFVGIRHYAELVQDPWFWSSLTNAFVFTVASVILHIFIGMVLAILLNETWFSTTLRNIMRGLLILPWVFSHGICGTHVDLSCTILLASSTISGSVFWVRKCRSSFLQSRVWQWPRLWRSTPGKPIPSI